MVKKTWHHKIIVIVMIFAAMTVAYSCKGSESRKAAEEIRDEVTGNRAVKQGEQMKDKINDIEKQSAERNENFQKQMGELE